MSDYLPFGNDFPAAQLARRVDRLCDRFEAAWKAGQRPHLERYLAKAPPEVQSELLRELLVLELEYRYQSGEKPQPEEYRLRFPQHTELIDTVFSEATQAPPSSPYLLRRWTMSRLVSQLRLLAFPQEQGEDPPPEVLSLLGEILSRTAAKESRAPGETPLAPGGPESPTKLLEPGKADTPVRGEAGPGGETPAITVLGDYELLNQLGKGGMGVVYRARQRSINRIVALKVIRSDRLEQLSAVERQEWFERFRRESQIAACLDHDNLVAVYEVGQADGQHFYSMRFVDGQSLAEILRKGPLPNQRAAAYLEQVARALHALHLRGIVHRDLKPRNILVDTNDRPLVTDFGLAKGAEYTRGLTHLGQCVGTPEYMSPEQVRNPATVQAASDLYSLGATLYELLTARPPFTAADPVETLRQVQDEEPLSPRRLNPAVHRDLELICLKCLEKEPHKRYASTLQVADELRRYRTGEPLRHTRPVGNAERVWRWCRRKPALAAASSLALVALIAVVISVGFAAYQSHVFVMYQAGVIRDKQFQLAESAFNNGLAKCTEGKVSEGMLWLAHSLELAPADAPDHDRLIRTNLTSWSRLLSPLTAILPHDKEVVAVAFSKDDQTIFTATCEKLQLWEAGTDKPIGRPLALLGGVLAAALSPDGKMILTGGMDKTARLWEASTGRLSGRPLQHNERVMAVAFSADGNIVMTGSWDETARLWDAATGQPIGQPLQHKGPVLTVAFSPDGKTVLTGSEFPPNKGGEARLWEVASGRLLRLLPHQDNVWAAAFSPDGKTALTGSYRTAQLWDAVTGQPIGAPFLLQESVMALAFSPDGKMIMTGSLDRTAQLWEVSRRMPVGPCLHHRGRITSLAFSHDGKFVLTGSADKRARLWEVASRESHCLPLAHQGETHAAAFSHDGKMLVTAGGAVNDGKVQIWDVATGKPHGPCLEHQKLVRAVAFSPDGKTLLTGSWDKAARLWDVATGRLLSVLHHQGEVWAVAFSPDGKTALTGSLDGTAQLWDTDTGQPNGPPLNHRPEVFSVAFSPDSKIIVTGSNDGTAQVWDAATMQPIGPPLRHKGCVWNAVFSSDARFVLTGSADGTAQLWDAITGDRLGPPLRHQGDVWAVAFSPDGSLILTGSDDQTARLWETGTGRPRGALQHQGRVLRVAVSPDGRMVLTGSDDKTAQFWDAATGRQCGPPLNHQGMIGSVVFSPDGKTVLIGGTKTARLWEVPVPVEGTVERIVLWTKVITGMELDNTGAVQIMGFEAWHRCSERLKELGGAPPP